MHMFGLKGAHRPQILTLRAAIDLHIATTGLKLNNKVGILFRCRKNNC